jgi:hypothetical protein
VHVLANSITVMVEAPNEQRTFVQMDVPEPDFSLPGKTQVTPAERDEDEELGGTAVAGGEADGARPLGASQGAPSQDEPRRGPKRKKRS